MSSMMQQHYPIKANSITNNGIQYNNNNSKRPLSPYNKPYFPSLPVISNTYDQNQSGHYSSPFDHNSNHYSPSSINTPTSNTTHQPVPNTAILPSLKLGIPRLAAQTVSSNPNPNQNRKRTATEMMNDHESTNSITQTTNATKRLKLDKRLNNNSNTYKPKPKTSKQTRG
eukprot:723129_1